LSTFFQANSPNGATKNIWQEQLTLAKNSFYVKYDICRNFDKKNGPLESEPWRRGEQRWRGEGLVVLRKND
jgi:hypothetical protein